MSGNYHVREGRIRNETTNAEHRPRMQWSYSLPAGGVPSVHGNIDVQPSLQASYTVHRRSVRFTGAHTYLRHNLPRPYHVQWR